MLTLLVVSDSPLLGPYWVGRINSDGTYQLKDESGKVVKDGIKERDLQPF